MIWHTFFQPFIEFGFMRRALVVCLALSLSTTMLGVFLLLRRMMRQTLKRFSKRQTLRYTTPSPQKRELCFFRILTGMKKRIL